VKPYDILTVKNALVKSVCCVTGRTICSPVPISVPTFSRFRWMRTNVPFRCLLPLRVTSQYSRFPFN
jgi:hypothetical protein